MNLIKFFDNNTVKTVTNTPSLHFLWHQNNYELWRFHISENNSDHAGIIPGCRQKNFQGWQRK